MELKNKLDYYLYENNAKNRRSNLDKEINSQHFNTTAPTIPLFKDLIKSNNQNNHNDQCANQRSNAAHRP